MKVKPWNLRICNKNYILVLESIGLGMRNVGLGIPKYRDRESSGSGSSNHRDRDRESSASDSIHVISWPVSHGYISAWAQSAGPCDTGFFVVRGPVSIGEQSLTYLCIHVYPFLSRWLIFPSNVHNSPSTTCTSHWEQWGRGGRGTSPEAKR
jgi:hypothetical protein